jgi:hypothetical protein
MLEEVSTTAPYGRRAKRKGHDAARNSTEQFDRDARPHEETEMTVFSPQGSQPSHETQSIPSVTTRPANTDTSRPSAAAAVAQSAEPPTCDDHAATATSSPPQTSQIASRASSTSRPASSPIHPSGYASCGNRESTYHGSLASQYRSRRPQDQCYHFGSLMFVLPLQFETSIHREL